MLRPSTVLYFTFLTHAVAACEWGKHGENCEKRCSENCQVNQQRNLTHCNKETGECSDGCITGWYATQCDQHCSKNCLDNVCNHGNGHCTLGCSGNQVGDFCEITEALPGRDVRVKPDAATGLSTTHITVIITLAVVLVIIVVIVVILFLKRKSADCQKDRADPENPERMPLIQRDVPPGSSYPAEYAGVMERGKLERDLQKTEEVFEETANYRKVKEHLANFRHVTISGASGEGKTSMALMLGSEYQKKGYELYFVNNISEFKLSAVGQGKDQCFIFDDIFGTVEISTDLPHLRRILENLNSCLEQMESDVSEDSNHQEKNMGNICIIFTTKLYNLKQGISHLGTHDYMFFKGTSVINLTHTASRYTMDEKKQIFLRHKKYNKSSHDFDLEIICCNDDTIFGFPLTCKQFFSFPPSPDKYEEFFKAPLTSLRRELESLLYEKNNNSAALILMLICEGNLNLSELEVKSHNQVLENHLSTVSDVVNGFNRSEVAVAVKNFSGTYFTKGDITRFSHPAIYDACAFVYCEINCAFILQHCSIQFLYERVQAQTVPACKTDEDRHVIYVSDAYNDIIASRLAGAVRQGNYRMSIMHPILERQDILDKVLAELKPTRTDTSVTDEHGNNMFHYACYSGNINFVRKLIPLCEINSKGDDALTPIMIAVMLGLDGVFHLLESAGADITLTNKDNDSCLHLACGGGNKPLVEYLLPKTDIDIRGKMGRTPLMTAALSGKKDVFDFLVSKGADITLTDDYNNNILHLACRGENKPFVEYLLPKTDVNIRGNMGWTPLMNAAWRGQKDVFDFLVSKGADISLTDDDNNNIFHLACAGGNKPLVEYLLPKTDINIRGSMGQTPLMTAALSGKKDVFDCLVSKGADITLTDDDNNNIIHVACEGGNKPLVEYLLPKTDINIRGSMGQTPLMTAALSGKKDVFDFLVAKGADITLTDDDNNNILHLACRGGNMPLVEYLLPKTDINTRGNMGWTPVMNAAWRGQKYVFDFLVSKGADITLTDDYNNNILHLASRGGNKPLVEYLLPKTDINTRGNMGWTPVMNAAWRGQKDVFDFLVSKGADITLTDDYNNNILHLASRGGNKPLVEYLLPKTDINTRGNMGWTPVMNAARRGKKDVFDFLVSKGADITLTDDDNNNILHLACRGGNKPLVEYLLPKTDINIRGSMGQTPLMTAALSGKKDVFDCLVSKGADITLTADDNDNILHLACEGGNKPLVEYLLSRTDINIRGNMGWTPLMYAALSGKKDVFDFLVSKGADIRLTDDDNDSILHMACRGGNRPLLEYLLPKTDINIKGNMGWTPLMYAAWSGKKDVFDFLVSKGADISLTDDGNDSILHLACEGGNKPLVKYLLPNTDINIRGNMGQTPLMTAALSGEKDVFDFLVSKGADITLTDDDNDNILHLACQGGNKPLVDYLLQKMDINCHGKRGWTPVMKGAYSGKKDTFDLLLLKGANPSLTGDDNETLLHAASEGGNNDIVKHVIGDFDINTRGWNCQTPLMRAVCGGHTDVVDFLVDHGADVNMMDKDGDSLLHLACEAGNLKMVNHVMSYSDIELRNKSGWTPLTEAAVDGNFPFFKYLKSEGAHLALFDKTGDDLATLALQGGCRAIMDELGLDASLRSTPWNRLMKSLVKSKMYCLEHYDQKSSDLVQTDQYGDSLLHLACRGGNIQCVEYLLQSYDINVRGRYNWTPVMMAAVCGHGDVFQLLVSHKADLTLVSDKGEDILTLARRGKNDGIVKFLLEESCRNVMKS